MDIIRTQIYLKKTQHRMLRQEAHRLGVSLTELLRRALDEFLRHSEDLRSNAPRGLSALTSLGQGSVTDGSLRHDDYVTDAIQSDHKQTRKPASNG